MNSHANRKSHVRTVAADVPWRIYLSVVMAGLVMAAIVGYGFYKGERLSTVDARMANAALQAKLEAMISNIVVEEVISHGIVGEPSEIWQHVDHTLRELSNVIAAGKPLMASFVPTDEQAVLPVIKNVISKLQDLKALTRGRFLKNEASLLQGDLDKQYERSFRDLLAALDSLEDKSRHIMTQNITRFRYTQAAMIFFCLSLSFLIGFIFHRYEKSRAGAYALIEKANADLINTVADLTQTEQALQKAHRDLEKKVAERTRDLSAANQKMREEISERRQAEDRLQKNMVMLQAIFDGISDNLMLVNRDMVVKLINKAAAKYYGLDASRDAVGRRCYQIAGRPGLCDGCAIQPAILKKNSVVFERKGLMNPNQTEQVAIYPLANHESGIEDAIVRISDITEKKLFEQRIMQSEKMASTGILVSAIAHEINNPNNFISFNIPILKEYLEELIPIIDKFADDDSGREFFHMPYDEFRRDLFKILDNIGHGSERISAFVANLKEFTHTDQNRLDKWIALNSVVEKAVALCKNKILKTAKTLSVEVPQDLPPILSDPYALEHVMVNLLINAAQAADKEDAWLKLRAFEAPSHPNHIVIEVSDNGCGMDQHTRRHLFDPFFTTKSIGEGTGLGLYVCYTLINELGGRIDVDSEPGRGSTFKIFLPLKSPSHRQHR